MPFKLLWPWIRLIDVMLAFFLLVRSCLVVGYTVVCDRFVVDTIVDLMVDTKDNNLCSRVVGRLILSFATASSSIFFLDASPAELLKRKTDVPSEAYFSQRRMLYTKAVSAAGGKVFLVDTAKPFVESHSGILSRVFACDKGNNLTGSCRAIPA